MVVHITSTIVQSYSICHRQCWLMSRQIVPDQEHPFIEIGRLIDTETYDRDRKKIELEDMVIDLIKVKDESVLIGEIKKTSRGEESAKLQLAFYLYRLKENGIMAKGVLLFPKERKRVSMELDAELEERLKEAFKEIESIIQNPIPPPVQKIKYCINCAYREFCWS